ncbi:MAG: TIGR00366 family protein [Phycisphaerae bacterium]
MERLGQFFARVTRRILPDPMVIACGLTLFVVLIAMVFPYTPDLRAAGWLDRVPAVASMWLDGVWNPGFLKFALQMCVVLLTGYGLAKAPIATRALHSLARRVRTNRSAVFLVTAVSCVGCWINWGFGLIAAGVLACRLRTELARRGVRCQYALIVAGAYAGMMIWHGGLSGSAPLRMAKEGVRMTGATGAGASPIVVGIERTTLSGANLALSAVLVLGVPILLRRMAARDPDVAESLPDDEPVTAAEPPGGRSSGGTLADRINRSRVISIGLALLAAGALLHQLASRGTAAINLNFVNTVFLTLGLLLHRNLPAYVSAVADGGRAVTGIVLQFPLYSGIQGVMAGAGIAAAMSQSFVEASDWFATTLHVGPGVTLPVATFLSAGVVNLLVPSGGGQWIVQGPIMCSAAAALSVPLPTTVMALSYGDQLTNMIQPFWAIPLMGLTGVNVREFMGYCTLLMLVATPVFIVALLLF